jgi:hypothetical protein
MTAVGKILMFFNLIFSLVVGAFVVMVYILHAHWADDFKTLEAKFKVADASNKTYQDELARQRDYTKNFDDQYLKDAELEKLAGIQPGDDLAAKLKKIKGTLKSATDDAQTQRAAVAKLTADLAAATQKSTQDDAALASSKIELDRRQGEVEGNRQRMDEQNKKIAGLIKDMNGFKDDAVSAKIQAKSLQERNVSLEKEKDMLARDNQRLIANGGSLVASAKTKDVNPPADNIEGLVREVGASGLVRITIGSDAGLVKGHTLEVYRLNEIAAQSKYLGRIKIVEVSATEAVGQPMGKMAPLQAGDQVSSRILDR